MKEDTDEMSNDYRTKLRKLKKESRKARIKDDNRAIEELMTIKDCLRGELFS